VCTLFSVIKLIACLLASIACYFKNAVALTVDSQTTDVQGCIFTFSLQEQYSNEEASKGNDFWNA
jgi:hypothetical protein